MGHKTQEIKFFTFVSQPGYAGVVVSEKLTNKRRRRQMEQQVLATIKNVKYIHPAQLREWYEEAIYQALVHGWTLIALKADMEEVH